jgi:hypothetical protein
MIYAFMYLVIGVGNYMQFVARNPGSSPATTTGFIEAAFFILLWPLQALFLTLVEIHSAIDWLLGKFMG